MDQSSRPGLFRTRNILGAVLAAGIVAGIYLGDVFKGLGGGSSLGIGISDPVKTSKESTTTTTAQAENVDIVTTPSAKSSDVIKVVIDGRNYALRNDDGEKAVKLSEIVNLAKAAKGDEDGVRVRIYRKMSSRVKAEEELKSALVESGLDEKEVVFIPTPIDAK